MGASSRYVQAWTARASAGVLVTVMGLGLLLAVASSSLPYLLVSPSTDPNLGALNDCLSRRLPGSRLGWAVSADGARAAAHGPSGLAVCGPGAAGFFHATPGVLALAFDGAGRLWLSQGGRLLRETAAGAFTPVGDFAPVALAGHADGVLALDARGQLLSVAPEGAVRAEVTLPARGGGLSVGPGGSLAAVVLEGGVLAYEAAALVPVRAASPCQVEALWWLDADSVLLGCGGAGGGLALTLNLRTGEWDAAPRASRRASLRLPARPLYVEDCDGLPCTAPSPLAADAR
ncbi:hypothetical protein P2318_30895 [Myxococcaceae bacterium GXIMD 01537]